MRPVEIVAGGCSLKPNVSLEEGRQIGQIQAKNGRTTFPGVFRLRGVDLKSRTKLDPTGKGMGCGWPTLQKAILHPGVPVEVPEPPSVEFARQMIQETGMGVASEVMFPHLQLPLYQGVAPEGYFMPWNPSVDQLGWHVLQIALFAGQNGWDVGIKNPKWTGMAADEVTGDDQTLSPMEETWLGLATYAAPYLAQGRLILIQRGVDVPEKGDYRNLPLHQTTARVKAAVQALYPGLEILAYIDPSHTNGKARRREIVEFTLESMALQHEGEFVYDGVLIEAGTSDTDTEQHITVGELTNLVWDLSLKREVRQRQLPKNGHSVLTKSHQTRRI